MSAIVSDVRDSFVHTLRRIRSLESELKFEQEMRDSSTSAISEIVKRLKAGETVTITDQWGDEATAYPTPPSGEDG